jgi:hypothetical protein
MARADRTAVVTVVAGFAAAAVAVTLLICTGFDPSLLVRAAPPLTNPSGTLPSLTVVGTDWQFDGQFYYRLAIDPFSSQPSVAGVSFDYPALRGSRMGFGILPLFHGRCCSSTCWA